MAGGLGGDDEDFKKGIDAAFKNNGFMFTQRSPKLQKMLNKLEKNGKGKSTWDIIWAYIKWRDGGLTIIPRVHLSSNVGVIGLHHNAKN